MNAGESVRSNSSRWAGGSLEEVSSAERRVGTVPSGGGTIMILRGNWEYEAPRLE